MVTPAESQPILAHELGITSLVFKREDEHPLGSHKGRSLPFMIDSYVKMGKNHFAISSSGNAALAAALYIQKHNETHSSPLTLDIFVGKHINEKKGEELKRLTNEHITVTQTDRPLQTLFTRTQDGQVQALRQSNDPTALLGYESLARELATIPDIKAIFIPTSSGTTAEALITFFEKMKKEVEIHIVQTMSCHPLAGHFTHVLQTDEISEADAIVDKTALRSPSLIPRIEKSHGSGWIITNEEIENAQAITEQHSGITLSPNSALGVAGLMQAVYSGRSWKGSVVCLITGK